MTKRFDKEARIVSNSALREDVWLMEILAPDIATSASAGQFCMLKPNPQSKDPLLRRPLSIHSVDEKNGTVAFLYRVVGRGTKLLASKSPDETLRVLGPLGNGFDIKSDAIHMLVGGGLGIAPLLLLAQRLQGEKAIVIIGASSKEWLLRQDVFAKTGHELYAVTEDGSQGQKGLVTDLLSDFLLKSTKHNQKILVYACGPMPMLKAVALLSKDFDAECQVSVETVMACGTGLCLGCAITGRNGFLHACKDGPCLDAELLDWSLV